MFERELIERKLLRRRRLALVVGGYHSTPIKELMDYFAAAGASLWSWAAGRVSPLSSAAPSREASLRGGGAFAGARAGGAFTVPVRARQVGAGRR